MPVNYRQIQDQIIDFSEKAHLHAAEMNNMRQDALTRLDNFATQPDLLTRKLEDAIRMNPQLRCARQTQEAINGVFPLPPAVPTVTLLAADGSQIIPNRQRQVEFCVINVGALRLCTGSGKQPEIFVTSQLLDADLLYTDAGLITEGEVALIRDLNERRRLVELAMDAGSPPPVITLTDGTLELYREPQPSPMYDRAFQEYVAVLKELAGTGAATAGYVDRPRSDLVIRLLEIGGLEPEQVRDAGRERPLRGLTDAGLFREHLNQPGDRSAVFAIQSASPQRFSGELEVHFFYLNVGRLGTPNLARVEIPAWVAGDPTMLDRLHAVLVAQSSILGSHPYPYLLHRAHEEAVITYDDSKHLEDMIVFELRQRGLAVEDVSNKQFAKELQGRTRL